MTSKERAKIAKNERAESAKDTVFQRLISEGEILFRERSYQEALDKFTEARERRPYNVNPKVKIEDLKALLDQRKEKEAKQSAEAKQETPSAKKLEPKSIPTPEAVLAVEDSSGEDVSKQVPTRKAKRELLPPISVPATEMPAGVTAIRPSEELPPSDPRKGGNEVEQRIFMQGTARILERRVHSEGKVAIFRKVTHEWGAIYYFKGSDSITKRLWDHEFRP